MMAGVQAGSQHRGSARNSLVHWLYPNDVTKQEGSICIWKEVVPVKCLVFNPVLLFSVKILMFLKQFVSIKCEPAPTVS